MSGRRRLSDILSDAQRDAIKKAWESTKPSNYSPLPAGEYRCRCLSGEAHMNHKGTPTYTLILEVADGDHAGRRVWHNLYLTPAALPRTMYELAKIGITTQEQLFAPLPAGILLRVRLAIRQDDDGTERNRVVRFEAAGVEQPDAYAPDDTDTATADTTLDPTTFAEPPKAEPANDTPPLPPVEPPPKAGKSRKRSQTELPLGDACTGPDDEGR